MLITCLSHIFMAWLCEKGGYCVGYLHDNLKQHAREDRGTGETLIRYPRKQDCQTIDWKSFLTVDRNKTELFNFVAYMIESEETATGLILITSKGQNVAPSALLDFSWFRSMLSWGII